jgi:crossover junction endodeoxyribonuclease RusA
MITLSLPFPPSVNRLWRAAKGGKVYRSAEYTDWRKLAMWQIAAQIKGQKHLGPYKLTILAVRPDKRKRDLGNLEKGVSDILVSQNIVEDDSMCEWLEIRWVEKGPSCKVIIEPIGDHSEGEGLPPNTE